MKWTGLRKAVARLKTMRKTEAVSSEIQARIGDHVNARCVAGAFRYRIDPTLAPNDWYLETPTLSHPMCGFHTPMGTGHTWWQSPPDEVEWDEDQRLAECAYCHEEIPGVAFSAYGLAEYCSEECCLGDD